MARFFEWFNNHSKAILATVVALQNSHLLGEKFSIAMTIASGLFSALSSN